MYRRILVAIDPEHPRSWSRALRTATSLARCFDAQLTLCTVVRDVDAAIEAEWSTIGYREMLEAARMRLFEIAGEADVEVVVEVGTGTICAGILDVAGRVKADLIVLASHRPAIKDYLLGANASRVVRNAPCSVLVVRGT